MMVLLIVMENEPVRSAARPTGRRPARARPRSASRACIRMDTGGAVRRVSDINPAAGGWGP